ncbi:hypothetical protein [Epilithonimonas zeae]|uniref:hypothetical protein n=1 Tax=Epilithonimonas zeae TaxID=1416779 RepID=UPI00200E3A0B|nr:hypothetical protein [Epilithonimonas zeae]UQB67784.1 hypothetical protein KI430_12165 [Epilithonimonas zeae]
MKYISVFLLLILFSCSFNTYRENKEEDKIEAEKITENFYEITKSDNPSNFLPLFSDDFFKITDKESFVKLFNETNNKYGKILRDSLIHWETLVVEGNNPKAEYLLVYEVRRRNTNSQEYFTLHKEKGDIKIFEYHVNIDTLSTKK